MTKKPRRRIDSFATVLSTYTAREAFLICETDGCRNVVAAWAATSGRVTCSLCAQREESG